MPRVGDKKFSYTDAGMRQANIEAARTGQRVEYEENNSKFGYQRGGSFSSGRNYGDRQKMQEGGYSNREEWLRDLQQNQYDQAYNTKPERAPGHWAAFKEGIGEDYPGENPLWALAKETGKRVGQKVDNFSKYSGPNWIEKFKEDYPAPEGWYEKYGFPQSQDTLRIEKPRRSKKPWEYVDENQSMKDMFKEKYGRLPDMGYSANDLVESLASQNNALNNEIPGYQSGGVSRQAQGIQQEFDYPTSQGRSRDIPRNKYDARGWTTASEEAADDWIRYQNYLGDVEYGKKRDEGLARIAAKERAGVESEFESEVTLNPATWLNIPTRWAMDKGRQLFGYDSISDILEEQEKEYDQYTPVPFPHDEINLTPLERERRAELYHPEEADDTDESWYEKVLNKKLGKSKITNQDLLEQFKALQLQSLNTR